MDHILYWNDVALEANRRDFSNVAGTGQPMPEQGWPNAQLAALAIVQLAITPKDGISDLCDPQWLPLGAPNSNSHVPLDLRIAEDFFAASKSRAPVRSRSGPRTP